MTIDDMIEALRTDLGDEASHLFTDATLSRCLRKAVLRLSGDSGVPLAIVGQEVVPEPEDSQRDLLFLLARIHACQVMRAATANAFSFTSGDKRVDKTHQPERWAQLEADLWAQYRAQLAHCHPEGAMLGDPYLITPRTLAPMIYELGSKRPCRS